MDDVLTRHRTRQSFLVQELAANRCSHRSAPPSCHLGCRRRRRRATWPALCPKGGCASLRTASRRLSSRGLASSRKSPATILRSARPASRCGVGRLRPADRHRGREGRSKRREVTSPPRVLQQVGREVRGNCGSGQEIGDVPDQSLDGICYPLYAANGLTAGPFRTEPSGANWEP